MSRYITEKEANGRGYMQLTEWGKLEEKLNTGQHGRISYEEWIEKEYDRITLDITREAGIIVCGEFIALCVNKVAGSDREIKPLNKEIMHLI